MVVDLLERIIERDRDLLDRMLSGEYPETDDEIKLERLITTPGYSAEIIPFAPRRSGE